MTDDFVHIPDQHLRSMIGKPVHCTWTKDGAVWILDRIDGTVAYLRTPKTHKWTRAFTSELCYIRRHQAKAYKEPA